MSGQYPATERHKKEQKARLNREYYQRRSEAYRHRLALEAAYNLESARLQAQVYAGQQQVFFGHVNVLGGQNQNLQQTVLVRSPFPGRRLIPRTFHGFHSYQSPTIQPPTIQPPTIQPPTIQSPTGEESKNDADDANDKVELIDPPEKKVDVLEIEDDGKVNAVECIMTPAKKPGDLAIFTPIKSESASKSQSVDQDPNENNDPNGNANEPTVSSLKARNQALEQEVIRLQHANTRTEQEKSGVERENLYLHYQFAQWQGYGKESGPSRKRPRYS